MTVMQGSRGTNSEVPHSKFIPEANRGWKFDQDGKAQMRNNTNSTLLNHGRRASHFLHFGSLWHTPRSKLKLGEASQGDTAVENDDHDVDDDKEDDDDDDDDDDEEEEQQEQQDRQARLHGRERSNSMPSSIISDDSRSFFANGSRLDRTFSRSSAIKRRSVQFPADHQDLLADMKKEEDEEEEDKETGPPLRPETLYRHNSKTPSLLGTGRKESTQYSLSRGYPWRRESEGEASKFINPFHRNPTGSQAFYDTHFGSSSGWQSVAGMADDVFHPFEKGKIVLSKWSGNKKEKRVKEIEVKGSKLLEERKRESLLSWHSLNSLGIFGGMMGNSNKSSASSSNTFIQEEAFEPELIPTIHRDPRASQYFKNLEGNIVILGGYRGSILRDAETHQMMWVPLKVGVGIRRPTLELGLTTAAEENSEDQVIADEMLSAISSMIDMGKRLINRCSTKKTKVYSWGYDWRLNLAKSSKRLEDFLYKLWIQSGEKEEDRRGAKVICHSMGGLVGLHALAMSKRPEIFESLVFASTPFLGTANILGPFRFGDAALFNDEICSPRATFSFRSSFYLLPVDQSERRDNDDDKDKNIMDTKGGRCFEEEDGTPHDLDFLDAETWNDLGFSPCVALGKRQEVLSKSRKRASSQGLTLDGQLERSASIRQDQGVRSEEETKTDSRMMPSFPGPDISMIPPPEEGSSLEKGSRPGLVEAATARAGQSFMQHGAPKEEFNLQPANRQKDRDAPQQSNLLHTTLSQDEWQEVMEDEASASWIYLEKVLAQTRQFFHELRTSFDQKKFDQGRYPSLAILTSGRTPTVRGALVKPTVKSDGTDGWKESVREGDYSRMLYGPGDGVILRRSCVTLPGEWGKLLVRGQAEDEDALTNHEGVVETSHRHVTLLSDVDGIGRCLEACRRAKVKI